MAGRWRRRVPPQIQSQRWTVPGLADLSDHHCAALLIASGLLGLVTIGDGFLYLALQQGEQIPPTYFPLMFVGTNFAYLALAIPLGKLADRIGRARVFVAGYLLLLGCYVIAGFHLAGIVGLVLVLLLLGSFYAATDGVLAALASRLVPVTSRASGISAAQTVVALARFGASVAFGVIWQFRGLQTAMVVMTAGLLIAIPVAGWLLHIRVRTDAGASGEPPGAGS